MSYTFRPWVSQARSLRALRRQVDRQTSRGAKTILPLRSPGYGGQPTHPDYTNPEGRSGSGPRVPGTPAGKGRSAPTAGDSSCGSSGDGPGRIHGVGGLRGLPRSAAGDVVPTDLPPLSSPDASSAVHAQTPSAATDLAHSGALFSRFLPDGEDRGLQPGLAAGQPGGCGVLILQPHGPALPRRPRVCESGTAAGTARGQTCGRPGAGRLAARSLGYGCTCFAFLRAYVRPSSLNTDFADKPSLTRPTVAVRTWPLCARFPV